LQSYGIKPIVQATLLITNNKHQFNKESINKKIKKLHIKLKDYCLSTNIIFVDLNHYFMLNNELNIKYRYDGIHLNIDGCNLWYSKIKDYFRVD